MCIIHRVGLPVRAIALEQFPAAGRIQVQVAIAPSHRQITRRAGEAQAVVLQDFVHILGGDIRRAQAGVQARVQGRGAG